MNKMKRIIASIVGIMLLATTGVAFAAPAIEYHPSMSPVTTNTYDLGSALKQWLTGYFGTICLSGDCKSAWPTGSGGGTDGNWVYSNGSGIKLATTSNQVLIGRTSTTTNSAAEINGTTTATNFVATSTTVDSVFPRLSVTNSTTTAATSTSLFSTLLRATTGYFTSLFLTPLATPSGSFLAVDANGQVIATTTPSSGSVSGGTAGMLTSWVNSTTLTATGTPTFANFYGTSTATSTLTGALVVGGSGTSTFSSGINLTSGGCYAIGGTCITGSGGGSGVGTVATSSAETANEVPFYTSNNGYPALLGTESGFHYDPSPTSQLFVPELRTSTWSDPTGATSINLGGTDVTLNSNGGLFKFNNGTAMMNFDTLSLTGARTATFQDASGIVAYLSDISGSGASSTLLGDNNTWSGVNRIGGDTNNLTLGTTLLYQGGTDYPQQPQAVFGNSLIFSFNQAAPAGDNGSGISFTANDGGTGNTNGGSIEFVTGLPSGTGATGTMQVYTGADLIFEGASSTVATSTFYSNVNVTGGLKIGTASINLLSGATSTFDKGINLPTGGCFAVAGTCVGGSGGSGASSTLLTDANLFSNATNTIVNLNSNRSTSTYATSTNLFSTIFAATQGSTTQFFSFSDNGWYNVSSSSVDVGAQANAAYAAGNANGVTIVFHGYGTSTFATPMIFSGFNKPVRLLCPEGMVLKYTGTGTSTLINTTGLNYSHKYGAGVDGCNFDGPDPFGTTKGLVIGGTNGGEGVNLNNVTIANFGTGLIYGDNTWNNSMNNGGLVYNGKNFQSQCTTNCGENWKFVGVNFVGNAVQYGKYLGMNCVDMSLGYISAVTFLGTTWDDCAPAIGPGTLSASWKGGQAENPGYFYWAKYPFWSIATDTQTHVYVEDFTIMNDAPTASTTDFVFSNGANLEVKNLTIHNNNTAGVIPLLAYNDPTTGQFHAEDVLFTSTTATAPVAAISNAQGTVPTPAIGKKISEYRQSYAQTPYSLVIDDVGRTSLYGNLYLPSVIKSTTTNATTTSLAVVGSATTTFVNGLEITGGCVKVAGTCLSSGGSGASSTLLSDSNLFSGATNTVVFLNSRRSTSTEATSTNFFSSFITGTTAVFQNILATASSTFQNFTAVNSTTTAATTTNFFTSKFSANGPLLVGTTSTTTIWGNGATSTFAGPVTTGGTGTSTFANGISITSGCFAIGSTCLSSGGSGASSTLYADNGTFTGANIFNNITRSTTTDATTTNIFSTKASTSAFFGAGLTSCAGASDAVTYANGSFGCHSITSGSAASTTLLGDNNTFSGVNNFTGKVGFGSSSPDSRFSIVSQASTFATLHIKQTSTDSSFAVYGEDEFGDVFYIDQYMSFYNTVAGIGLGVVPDGTVGALTLGTGTSGNGLNVSLTTSNRVGVGSSSPSSLLSVQGILGSQSPLFIVATTTGSNSFGSLFSIMANGTIMSTSPSGTTTKNRILNEPDGIAATAVVANYTATYSDDHSRMLACGAIASTGVIGVRNGSFAASGVTNVYLQTGTAQQLTAATMANGVTTIIPRGCVTAEGYHYVFLASTTNAAATAVRRATSSDFVNIAAAASWGTSTVSGVALATTGFLVGYERGTLYIATSTTAIAKYTVGTTSNTLTYAGTITITGANITFANTRVNDNGIYVGFAAAPMIRKYTLTGVAVNGANYVLTAIANGPDFLAMKNSVYAMSGGSTVFMSRIQGY